MYNKCAKDTRPSYKMMDEKAHLGSAYNANINIENYTVITDYLRSLESTVDCYEKQSKEPTQ